MWLGQFYGEMLGVGSYAWLGTGLGGLGPQCLNTRKGTLEGERCVMLLL